MFQTLSKRTYFAINKAHLTLSDDTFSTPSVKNKFSPQRYFKRNTANEINLKRKYEGFYIDTKKGQKDKRLFYVIILNIYDDSK